MPLGDSTYINPDAQRRLDAHRRLRGAGLAALAGGVLLRRPLAQAATSLLRDLSSSPPAQRVAQSLAIRTLDALEKASSRMAADPLASRYFRSPLEDSAPRIIRRDLHAARSVFERDLSGTIAYTEAGELTGEALRLGPGWDADKVQALLSDQRFFREAVQAGRDPATRIQASLAQGGKFRDFLSAGAPVSDESLKKTAQEIADAIHGGSLSGQHQSGINWTRIQHDASSARNPLRQEAGRAFAEPLQREAADSPLETLLGVRQVRASTSEREAFRTAFALPKGSLHGLRQDWQNAEFEAGGKRYDLSGYVRAGQAFGRLINERLAIPFAPLQTAVSPGQLFPFLRRAGDAAQAGLVDLDPLSGKFRLHVRGRILNEDGRWSEGHYSFLKANKRHLRELSQARSEAGGSSLLSGFRSLMQGSISPGTVPYWDAPFAVLRKWTGHAPHYLPNLLASAANGTLTGSRDALEVAQALRYGAKHLEDQDLLKAIHGLRGLGVGKDLGGIEERVAKGDWAGAYGDLTRYVSGRPGGAPRLRRVLDEMLPLSADDRALNFHLSGTASYRASREPDRLLGLHFGGSRRLTRLDVLKHDLLVDLTEAARASGRTPDEIAAAMKGAGPDVAAIAHAQGIEEAAASGGAAGLNAFVSARPEVQALLRDTARRKRSFLDLAPRERAPLEDFTDRKRLIPVREGVPYAEAYKAGREQGKSRVESVIGTTAWSRKFSSSRKAGKSIPNAAWESAREAGSGAGKAYGAGKEDTHGSLFAYWQVSRLHEAFEGLGWGLPAAWRTSPGKLAAGMLLFRLLPLTLLPEAHKLLNRVTRDVPGLRWLNPDLHRAHLLRLSSHVGHHVIDHRHLTGLLPGLDFYTDSRSAKEQDVAERYADYTPVRKGRWWLFGSREPVFGAKVSYYLPSASRLAQSDWQASSNVGANDWNHWAHVGGYFNPLNWGEGAYYRERQMQRAGLAPAMSGPAFDPGLVTSGPLNALFGWLKPRRFYGPNGGRGFRPVGLGGTMNELPRRGNSPGTVDPLALNVQRGEGPGGFGTGPVTRVPAKFRLTDPSRLGPDARVRAGLSTGVGVNSVTQGDYAFLSRIGVEGALSRSAHQYQELSGLYGWMAGILNPELSRPLGKTNVMDASRGYGVEQRFWDQELGGLGGGVSDVLRRFFPHRLRSIHDWDELPNQMPDWLPADLRRGNPQARIPMGALRLPGAAYSASHPGTKETMLRMRASALGKTPEEIRETLTHPEGDGRTSAAAELGTKMHRVLQDRWRKLGILEADEVSVYDKKLDVSGHLDGILRMRLENGQLQRTIVDIKTKTAERFAAVQKTGVPEEENLEQIQFYMHATGIHHALLTYVNREDTSKIFEVPIEYDPRLMKHIIDKLQGVREGLRKDVREGKMNEGQLYSAIDKYEILADVSPNSDEFRHMAKWARDSYDGLTPDDKYRVDATKERLKRKREGFELHDYRFQNLQLKSENVRIQRVLSATSFEDEAGQKYTLAGVKATNAESPHANAKELWEAELGLSEGSKVRVLTAPGDRRGDRKATVMAGGVNVAKRLSRLGFAEEDGNDFSAPAIRNRFSRFEVAIGRVLENVAHLNNPLNTKLLPVRSGLEQYTRTDVYGKAHGGWDRPITSYLRPTLDSMMNKPVLTAAAFGAFFGSLFAQHPAERLVLAGVGAATFAATSILSKLGSSRDKPPIPRSTQERRNVEEYYDNLTYLKYKALAAREGRLAYEEEGINVDDLRAGRGAVTAQTRRRLEALAAEKRALIERGHEERESKASAEDRRATRDSLAAVRTEEKELRNQALPLGEHALRAVLYRDRALSTLRGSLETGDTNAALRALPSESRQAIEDVVRNGTDREKARLYALLPGNQKSALGAALGRDPRTVPKGTSLAAYFRKHPLPKENWKGWDEDLSLELIEAKDIVDNHKGLDPMDFGLYPGRIEEATLMSPEASVGSPRKSAGSHHFVQAHIEALLAGHGMKGRVRVECLPPSSSQSSHQASVTVNVKHRREHATLAYAK